MLPAGTAAAAGGGTRPGHCEVGESALEAEVEDDVDQCVAQPRLQRIVAAIRRRIGVDVLGRDRRPDEDELVVEIDPMEDLHRHRVEEGFCAFGLFVIDQKPDEMTLDVLPQRVRVEPRGAELAQHAIGGFLDAAIVEVDPVTPHVLASASTSTNPYPDSSRSSGVPGCGQRESPS